MLVWTMKLCYKFLSENVHGCTQIFFFENMRLCILLKVIDENIYFINVTTKVKQLYGFACHHTY